MSHSLTVRASDGVDLAALLPEIGAELRRILAYRGDFDLRVEDYDTRDPVSRASVGSFEEQPDGHYIVAFRGPGEDAYLDVFGLELPDHPGVEDRDRRLIVIDVSARRNAMEYVVAAATAIAIAGHLREDVLDEAGRWMSAECLPPEELRERLQRQSSPSKDLSAAACAVFSKMA